MLTVADSGFPQETAPTYHANCMKVKILNPDSAPPPTSGFTIVYSYFQIKFCRKQPQEKAIRMD